MTDLAEDPAEGHAPRRRSEAWLRRAFPLVAWVFVGCVVIQFFLVGLRVFDAKPFTELHSDFAYLYGWLTPILVLFAASPAGSPRALRLAAALLVLFAVQTFLPLLAKSAPGLGAFHALNALVVAWFAVALARAARSPDSVGT